MNDRHVIEPWQHSHVGRFRVEGVLGRGGMGVVLRAHDPHLQRPVAIKLLTDRRAPIDDGTTVNLRERADHDRLLDEARALAQITDPNVLAVHEIGQERGQTFLVMELVDGVDLRRWLAAAPRGLDEVLAVFAQAARGLAAAHRRGIIHRDFKPENVLISVDGRVRVCDFGIAAFARSSELIHTGAAGTPRYMAPELLGDQPASVQSDVYGFAATLVEAICGSRDGGPGTLDRELERRGVPPHLRAVIARALDPDPARRPPAIEDVTRAFVDRARPRWVVPAVGVAAVVAASFAAITIALAVRRDHGAAPTPCDDTTALLDARWGDRERARVRAAVAATAASPDEIDDVVARLDDYARSWRRLRTETCAATVPDVRRAARLACLERRLFELGSTARALAATPSRELAIERSAALPDLGSCIEAAEIHLPDDPGARAAIEELTAKVVALYDRGLATIGSEGDQAALIASRQRALALGDVELAVRVERIRGQLLGNAGKLAEAERVFDDGYQLATAHHLDAIAALTLAESAGIARRRDDLGDAESRLRIARALLDRSPDATPYAKMRLYRAISEVAAERGNHAAAREALDAAADAVARMQPRAPLWTAELTLARAQQLDREGKLNEALAAARDAEAQLRKLGRQGVPDLGETLALVATLERQRGRLDEALAIARERVALFERELPEPDPQRVYAEGALGLDLLDAGAPTEAKARFERTLARIEARPELARMRTDFLGYLARAERALGDFDRARTLVQRAIDDERRGGRPLIAGFHEVSYAYLELEAGDFDRAALHAQVAETLLAARPADHADRLDLAEVAIYVALGQDKLGAADQAAARTLALLEERHIDDARNERFWIEAAAVRALLGRPAEARDLARRALDRRTARHAPPLDVAVAEAEVVRAGYLLDHDPRALDRLRRLVRTLDDPRTRIDHARLARWLAAHHAR